MSDVAEITLGSTSTGNLLEGKCQARAVNSRPCSVGEQLQVAAQCHAGMESGVKSLGELNESDCLVLQLRTGLMGLTMRDTVCLHHLHTYGKLFEDAQKVCCDPFDRHRKPIRKGLQSIGPYEAMVLEEKFDRRFVPGWKLCSSCRQMVIGNAQHKCDLDNKGRAAKALRSLEFNNPGQQGDFASDSNQRDKRKVIKPSSNDRQPMGPKSKVYDSRGLLIANGRNMCDCLDVDCVGCFYPCPECGSRMCGVECRCNRRWLYEQVEVEGGEIIRNKFAS